MEAGKPRIAFSVVMVTYARDHIVRSAIEQVAAAAEGRGDIEFILVDNNEDRTDRSAFIPERFASRKYVKHGFNKGVSARNDGAFAAEGAYIAFVDDDAFLNPPGVFDRYEEAFASDPLIAIVTARHIDKETGETPRASFPHTDKRLPKDRPFQTFRFQGNGFAMRRTAFEAIGPMSNDYLYGMEEIDYAYKVIDAGFKILYDPSVWVVEHNDPGGRLPERRVQTMRLTNKMIISFKYMPARYVPLSFFLFSAYVLYLNKLRLNPLESFGDFLRWARANPGGRRPIGPDAIRYIRECGGQPWK
ncbi:MAG: glycosyltransferase [Acetobacteraceae bacterium]|nr:glycosyltransferase [Acetobacteraceae bacterium]